MGTATLVCVEEYLSTTYEPDRELVDGCLVERNVASQLHGLLETIVAANLREMRKEVYVFTETRLLVDAAKRKYRVPDIMAVERPITRGRAVVDIPALTIEIMSPDDTFYEALEKCFEYDALGVANIIVMDPEHSRQYVFESNALRLIPSILVTLPKCGLTLELPHSIFAELDELR